MKDINESGDADHKERTFLTRGYLAAIGQGRIAIFMEIFLDRGNSKLSKTERQENVEDLYEYHPNLLWAASVRY